jgi:AsmA protein
MSEKSPKPRRRPVWLRVLAWTGITVGALVVLIIIAIFVIPFFVNTGLIKRQVENVASHETGRRIAIAGPLSLSLFPWVGFDAHNVTMANAKGFGPKPFLHAKEAKIYVKVWPLLFHHVQVSGVAFGTPTLNLVRDKRGRTNWRDLTGGGKKPTSRPGKNNAPLAHVSVASITINDGTLEYTNAEAGKHYRITGFGLKANHLAPDKPFPLSFHTRLSSDHPHFRAQIKFNASAEFDKSANKANLAKGTLGARVTSFGGNEPINLNAQWKRIALDSRAGTATLSGLSLAFSGLRARLDAKATQLNKDPRLAGHLDVPPFSPRKLLAALGKPMPRGIKGFNRASLGADLNAKTNALALANLVLKLDDSTITGSAGIPNLAKRSLRFDLAFNRINLADYLVAGATQAHVGAAHGKTFTQTRLPGRLLKNLVFNGKLAIGKLTGFGLEAKNLSLNLNAAHGKLEAAPIAASVYSGSYRGAIAVTSADRGMRLKTTDNLKDIDLAQLIASLSGTKRLSGTGELQFTLAGEGATVGELLSTLTGKAKLSIADGALEGVDLWTALKRAWLFAKKHVRVPATGPKRTKIVNLKTHAVLDKGKLTTDTLVARLPFLSVTGHGNIDFFNHNAVNYKLLATVLKTPKVSGESLTGLKGAEVPIRLSGNLENLAVFPDIATALKARGESRVKKKLDEQKKKLRQKLSRELHQKVNDGG